MDNSKIASSNVDISIMICEKLVNYLANHVEYIAESGMISRREVRKLYSAIAKNKGKSMKVLIDAYRNIKFKE